MKTKITAVLMAMMFFFSISVLADNDPPVKAKKLDKCSRVHPIPEDGCIDYTRPTWWINPPESFPDER